MLMGDLNSAAFECLLPQELEDRLVLMKKRWDTQGSPEGGDQKNH